MAKIARDKNAMKFTHWIIHEGGRIECDGIPDNLSPAGQQERPNQVFVNQSFPASQCSKDANRYDEKRKPITVHMYAFETPAVSVEKCFSVVFILS